MASFRSPKLHHQQSLHQNSHIDGVPLIESWYVYIQSTCTVNLLTHHYDPLYPDNRDVLLTSVYLPKHGSYVMHFESYILFADEGPLRNH